MKKIFSCLIFGLLCFFLPLSACAQEQELVGHLRSDGFYPLPYRSSMAWEDVSEPFYYSEHFFDHPATEYDHSLALATLGVSLSASTKWTTIEDYAVTGFVGREDNLVEAYAQLGFGNVELHGYDKSRNDPSDSIAYSFAQKTWADENGARHTLLAVFPRGMGYGAEWTSNLHLGSGSSHAGFTAAAEEIFLAFERYYASAHQNGELGTVQLWIGGFSRGGSAANLFAAKVMHHYPEFTEQNTYVYTYAASAALTAQADPELLWDHDNNHTADDTLKECWSSSNIFNIVNSIDLVSRLLPSGWGYYRNGNDRFLPAPTSAEEIAALNALYPGILDFSTLPSPAAVTSLEQLLQSLLHSKDFYAVQYEPLCMELIHNLNIKDAPSRSIPDIYWDHRTEFSAGRLLLDLLTQLPSLLTDAPELSHLRAAHSPESYLALMKYYAPEQHLLSLPQ